MLKDYLKKLWHNAASENNKNLSLFLERDPKACVLDLGCDDGRLVKERIESFVGTENIWGVDIDDKILGEAKKRGIKPFNLDLNKPLPFKNDFFDIIQANQIIEHLHDTDTFSEEIYRILKPGGYLVISSENLSSWHNLMALALGFQAPSQDVSSKFRIGNPLSLCQERPRVWTAHQRIFTLLGLKKLLEAYGFIIERTLAAGYYPLPGFLAKVLTRIDPVHAPFIAIKARKR